MTKASHHKAPYFAVVYGGAIYGYSRSYIEANAAWTRGVARGARVVGKGAAEIVERKSPPKGMRVNEWLPPFDYRKAGFER